MSAFYALLAVDLACTFLTAGLISRGHLTITAKRRPKPRRTETQA